MSEMYPEMSVTSPRDQHIAMGACGSNGIVYYHEREAAITMRNNLLSLAADEQTAPKQLAQQTPPNPEQV
jgi:hypothetical protein